MPEPILTTKLYIPPLPTNLGPRPHLIEKLNQGFQRMLTIVSAPAGFGKTKLMSECVMHCELPIAWFLLAETFSATKFSNAFVTTQSFQNYSDPFFSGIFLPILSADMAISFQFLLFRSLGIFFFEFQRPKSLPKFYPPFGPTNSETEHSCTKPDGWSAIDIDAPVDLITFDDAGVTIEVSALSIM